MTDRATISLDNPAKGWQAVATLYHNLFTGLTLAIASREGHDVVGEWAFNLFRRQHHEKFLSSFDKLGLSDLPHAVAAARYHCLSNRIGGVEVEYVEESDTKAWIRFPHPRWIYMGTAICGIPDSVGKGFVNGWYGQNGVSLQNPRLGFVCTSQDTHASYGFSGYFQEFDYDLSAKDRARFTEGEIMPPVDLGAQPTLDPLVWTQARLDKARRNYAMEYIRNGLVELTALIGEDRACAVGEITAQLIGRQFYPTLIELLGRDPADRSADAFGCFMALMAAAHDDRMDIASTSEGLRLEQQGWRLTRGMDNVSPVVFTVWNALWEGCLSVHDRFRQLHVSATPTHAEDVVAWHIN